jgi:hypothetical protein
MKSTDITTIISDNTAALPTPVAFSLIRDSELTENELSHVRNAFVRFSGDQDGCFPVILQNLWTNYGLTFTSDRTLLYGTLIWITGTGIFDQKWTSSQKIEHYTFKSRFHKHMLKAIDKRSISECHFFALCFAFFGTSDREEQRVYTKGLLDVLRILNEQYDNGVGFQEQQLRYLYHYVLSFVRRCGGVEYPRTVQMERDLYYATENLVEPHGGIPDARVTHGNLVNLQTFPGSVFSRFAITWMLRNEIHGLMATYKTMASTKSAAAATQLTNALTSIRCNIKATQALPEVHVLFQSVRSTLESKVTW